MAFKLPRLRRKKSSQTFRTTIPATLIEDQVEEFLHDLARTTKLPGFRPGKAPMAVVRQRFGEEAASEVLPELINRAVGDMLREQEVNVVWFRMEEGYPKRNADEDLELSIEADLAPEIRLRPFENLRVSIPRASVTDADVEKWIETMALHMADVQAREEDYAATEQDVLDLEILNDAKKDEVLEVFDKVSPTEARDTWWRAELVGLKKGDERKLDPRQTEEPEPFPLAIRVKQVYQRTPVPWDKVMESMKINSEEDLKNGARRYLENRLKEAVDDVTMHRTLEALLEAYPFPVSERLLESRLEDMLGRRMPRGSAAESNPVFEVMRKNMERTVRLEQLLDEIGRQHDVRYHAEDVGFSISRWIPEDAKDPKAAFQQLMKDRTVMGQAIRDVVRTRAARLVRDGAQREFETASCEEVVKASNRVYFQAPLNRLPGDSGGVSPTSSDGMAEEAEPGLQAAT